jgi:hypothetical protein
MKDTSTDAKRALRAQAELLAKLRKSRTEKTVDAIMQQLEKEEQKREAKEEQKREAKEAKALNRIQKKKSSSSKPASRSKTDSNKKKKVTTKKAKKEIKSIIYDESHEGYSDEEGSVESGILDEKVCCECGIKTDRKKECEELVLCDVCDSEYHMKCVGMERTRTRALVWTCPRCLDEETHFSSLSFLGGQKFQVLAILSILLLYHSVSCKIVICLQCMYVHVF